MLGGYATIGSYLPSKRISVAIAATFRGRAFDAQGNVGPHWTELYARIGKVLAPRDAPVGRGLDDPVGD